MKLIKTVRSVIWGETYHAGYHITHRVSAFVFNPTEVPLYSGVFELLSGGNRNSLWWAIKGGVQDPIVSEIQRYFYQSNL